MKNEISSANFNRFVANYEHQSFDLSMLLRATKLYNI